MLRILYNNTSCIIILHVCNSYCLFEHDCLATVATYGNERVNVKCQLSLVSTLPRYLRLPKNSH